MLVEVVHRRVAHLAIRERPHDEHVVLDVVVVHVVQHRGHDVGREDSHAVHANRRMLG